jgi:hypothetical protein
MTLTDVISKRNVFGNSAFLKNILVNNTSGSGYIEVSGTTDAFIDFKIPSSDDFDLRLITSGDGGQIQTSNNKNLGITTGTGNVTITSGSVGIGTTTPTEKLQVVGRVLTTSLLVNNPTGEGSIEVGGPSGAYIDLKSPASDDTDLRIGTSGVGGYISTIGNGNILFAPGGSGCVRINNIQTYANNAAAITGGLEVNSVYKTVTGELRIVV